MHSERSQRVQRTSIVSAWKSEQNAQASSCRNHQGAYLTLERAMGKAGARHVPPLAGGLAPALISIRAAERLESPALPHPTAAPEASLAKRQSRRTQAQTLASLQQREASSRRARRPARGARRKTSGASRSPACSPEGLASHRERLELSAADYGALRGVTGETIHDGEPSRVRPQKRQLGALAEARKLAEREAWARLGYG